MIISQTTWQKYVQKLSQISKAAAAQLQAWIDANGLDDMKAMINYAIALSDKYGEAGASLAAQMYDEIAQASRVSVPSAEVANTPTYKEVAKAMYGTVKNNQKPAAAMERLVKLPSQDTMRKNAIRDGAQWAWVPSGDSCAFCMTLASRGWQKASKKTLKGDHCEHIHAHCDCQFMIRFNSNTNVEGFNPQEYKRIYDNAGGNINAIRRDLYKLEKNNAKIKLEDKTIHIRKRQIERKVNDEDIDDALIKPLKIIDQGTDKQGRKSVKYIGERATVIINPDTKNKVTTWPTSSRKRRKLKND